MPTIVLPITLHLYLIYVNTIPIDNLSVETIVQESGPTEAGTKNISLTCIVHHDGEEARFPSAEWWTATAPVLSGDDIELTETVTNATTSASHLFFLILHTSHAGLYTCWGKVLQGEAEIISVSQPVVIPVRRMSLELEHVGIRIFMLNFLAVPTPNVTLSVSSGPLEEGSSLMLTCTATLPPSVDTDVNITVKWTPNTNSNQVLISPPSSLRSPFISTLALSPLATTDSGLYSCEVTVSSSSQYIADSSTGQSQGLNITVTGMLALHM